MIRSSLRATVTLARLPLWKKSIYMFRARIDLVVKLKAAVINEGVSRECGDHTVD